MSIYYPGNLSFSQAWSYESGAKMTLFLLPHTPVNVLTWWIRPGGFCRGWGTEDDMGSDKKHSLPGRGLADALENSCKMRMICLASPGNLTLLPYPQTHARLQPSISSVLPSSKLSEWLACQSWHGQSVARMGPGLYSASATDNNVRK